jgi:organic radical activating enzyme
MSIKISEIFYSLQGEGQFAGVPSIFIRTFGCNFNCSGFGMSEGQLSQERMNVDPQKYSKFEDLPLVATGCDSYGSWDPRFKHLSKDLEIDEVVEQVLKLLPESRFVQSNGNDVHLVITGGEPLLGWQKQYPALLKPLSLLGLKNLTFETNGTQALDADLRKYLKEAPFKTTFSVSPKLKISGHVFSEAIKPEVVKEYTQAGHVFLKFVVSGEKEIVDVNQALETYNASEINSKVYLMPVGGLPKEYLLNKHIVSELCAEKGFYFSPRLQVELWGNEHGT